MPDAVGSAASAENPMVKAVSGEHGPETVEFPPPPGHPALKDTGNGPDVSYEEAALEALYGPPDADGVYGKGGAE